jgi:hypothetical protein
MHWRALVEALYATIGCCCKFFAEDARLCLRVAICLGFLLAPPPRRPLPPPLPPPRSSSSSSSSSQLLASFRGSIHYCLKSFVISIVMISGEHSAAGLCDGRLLQQLPADDVTHSDLRSHDSCSASSSRR